MTRDEILKLARDAGMTCYGASQSSSGHHSWHAYTPHLETFARLVRDAALEEAAVLIELTDLGKLPDNRKLAAATMLSAYAEAIRALKENAK